MIDAAFVQEMGRQATEACMRDFDRIDAGSPVPCRPKAPLTAARRDLYLAIIAGVEARQGKKLSAEDQARLDDLIARQQELGSGSATVMVRSYTDRPFLFGGLTGGVLF